MKKVEYLKMKERLIEFFKQLHEEREVGNTRFIYYQGIRMDAALHCGCACNKAFNEVFDHFASVYNDGWRLEYTKIW